MAEQLDVDTVHWEISKFDLERGKITLIPAPMEYHLLYYFTLYYNTSIIIYNYISIIILLYYFPSWIFIWSC